MRPRVSRWVELATAGRGQDIYARALRAVPGEEKLAVVELYVSKAMDFFGVGKVRSIYEVRSPPEPGHPNLTTALPPALACAESMRGLRSSAPGSWRRVGGAGGVRRAAVGQ